MSTGADRSWYVAVDGARQGPYTQAEILGLLEEGKVSPQDLCWQQGMPKWLPISWAPPFQSACSTAVSSRARVRHQGSNKRTLYMLALVFVGVIALIGLIFVDDLALWPEKLQYPRPVREARSHYGAGRYVDACTTLKEYYEQQRHSVTEKDLSESLNDEERELLEQAIHPEAYYLMGQLWAFHAPRLDAGYQRHLRETRDLNEALLMYPTLQWYELSKGEADYFFKRAAALEPAYNSKTADVFEQACNELVSEGAKCQQTAYKNRLRLFCWAAGLDSMELQANEKVYGYEVLGTLYRLDKVKAEGMASAIKEQAETSESMDGGWERLKVLKAGLEPIAGELARALNSLTPADLAEMEEGFCLPALPFTCEMVFPEHLPRLLSELTRQSLAETQKEMLHYYDAFDEVPGMSRAGVARAGAVASYQTRQERGLQIFAAVIPPNIVEISRERLPSGGPVVSGPIRLHKIALYRLLGLMFEDLTYRNVFNALPMNLLEDKTVRVSIDLELRHGRRFKELQELVDLLRELQPLFEDHAPSGDVVPSTARGVGRTQELSDNREESFTVAAVVERRSIDLVLSTGRAFKGPRQLGDNTREAFLALLRAYKMRYARSKDLVEVHEEEWKELVEIAQVAPETLLEPLSAIARYSPDLARYLREHRSEFLESQSGTIRPSRKPLDARSRSLVGRGLPESVRDWDAFFEEQHERVKERYERSVEPLIVDLEGGNRSRRYEAALDLSRLGDERAVEPLVEALEDQDNDELLRYKAMRALGGLRDRRAIAPLIEVLGDKNAGIRSTAASELMRITGQSFGEDRAKWEEWLRTERLRGVEP